MLRRIRLKNWKTHLRTEIRFEKGINCILGNMGSGKTSVLEAVCFALYGTLPAVQSRKRKISDLIMKYPSKKTEAEVELEIEISEGKTLSVLRKINAKKGTYHSEVRLNGKLLAGPQTAEVTEKIFELLKIDYDTFVQIIYGEQNNIDSVLSMNPAKRKEKMDELLRINKLEVSRSVLVSLSNRMKRKIKELCQELNRRKAEFDAEEMRKAEKEIKEIRARMEEKEKMLEDFEAKRKEIERQLKKLEAVRKEIEKMRYEIKSKTAVMEHLLKEVERVKSFYGWVENKEELERKKEELESLERRYNEIVVEIERKKQILRNLRNSMEKIKNELNDLENLAKGVEGRSVEEVEKAIEEKIKEQKAIIDSIARLKAKKDEINEVLSILASKGESIAKCPVCDSELSKEKMKELREKKLKEAERLKDEIERKSVELKEIEDKIKELEKEKTELIKIFEKVKSAEKLKEEFRKCENEIKINEEDVEKLKKEMESMDIEKIRREKTRVEKLFEAFEKKERVEKLEKEIKELEERVNSIEFDEEELESLRKKMVDVVSEIKGLQEKIAGLKRLLMEKEKNLEILRRIERMIQEMERKMERYEKVSDFLDKFRMAIEKTQIDLREEFISAINDQMNRIWEVFYPYGDYQDIKVFPEDNYSLKLLNSEGEWVNADSFVSGGERMMAALTLRLAMASILSPSFKMIILDEPTHNLDSTGVEELGKMLKERMKQILEQTILITHDSLLAETSADKIFVFERGEDKTGFTKVREL